MRVNARGRRNGKRGGGPRFARRTHLEKVRTLSGHSGRGPRRRVLGASRPTVDVLPRCGQTIPPGIRACNVAAAIPHDRLSAAEDEAPIRSSMIV